MCQFFPYTIDPLVKRAWYANKQEIRKAVSLGGNGEEYSKCTQSLYRLAIWVKFSADDILKSFSYFSQKTGFDISFLVSLEK